MKMMSNQEFNKFNTAMDTILKANPQAVKDAMEKDKTNRARKRKAKRASADRASNDKD